MSLLMTEQQIGDPGFQGDSRSPACGEPVPDESWDFNRLGNYARSGLGEADRLIRESIQLGRRSTVQIFRAGRAIWIARERIKAEKWGGWGSWLAEHGLARTTAWEAAALYERAGSEEAIKHLTPDQAKQTFGITRRTEREEPENAPQAPHHIPDEDALESIDDGHPPVDEAGAQWGDAEARVVDGVWEVLKERGPLTQDQILASVLERPFEGIGENGETIAIPVPPNAAEIVQASLALYVKSCDAEQDGDLFRLICVEEPDDEEGEVTLTDSNQDRGQEPDDSPEATLNAICKLLVTCEERSGELDPSSKDVLREILGIAIRLLRNLDELDRNGKSAETVVVSDARPESLPALIPHQIDREIRRSSVLKNFDECVAEYVENCRLILGDLAQIRSRMVTPS
jgi:hypothetical protein